MHTTSSQIIGEQKDFMYRSPQPTDLRDHETVTSGQAKDQLIQQRALCDSGGFFHNDSGRPGTAKYIDLTILGLIGRRNAGVPNDIGGLTIHQATVLCHLPLVTNKVKADNRFPNSGKRYAFRHLPHQGLLLNTRMANSPRILGPWQALPDFSYTRVTVAQANTLLADCINRRRWIRSLDETSQSQNPPHGPVPVPEPPPAPPAEPLQLGKLGCGAPPHILAGSPALNVRDDGSTFI
jgi:hypothetical protein